MMPNRLVSVAQLSHKHSNIEEKYPLFCIFEYIRQKDFTPKLFYSLNLDQLVPLDDFYRKLNKSINLHFLYPQTQSYYGSEGQCSIYSFVFFKVCIVGYLNNIVSDCTLIRLCCDNLSVRFYPGYDLDEELPWLSTISRTRNLFGEGVFLELFRKVLALCVEKGMVSDKCQAVDSAFIKGNASIDSLLEKEILDDVERYADELDANREFKVSAEKKKTRGTAPQMEREKL